MTRLGIETSATNPFDILSAGWVAFLLVYEFRSFSKAADILGVSQPALTKRIKRLEDEVGIDLFDRQLRPIRPTPEAMILKEELVRVAGHAGQVLMELKTRNYMKPVLRLGCVESLSSYLVPQLAKEFVPRLSLFAHYMGSSDILISRLLKREADVIIICDAYDEISSLSRTELFEEPSILLFPKSLTKVELPRSWAELAYCGLPLISSASNTGASRLNMRFLDSAHLEFASICEVDSDAVMVKLVADGIGWAITRPSTLLAETHAVGKVQVLPTPEPGFSRKIWCISRVHELETETAEICRICKTVFSQTIFPMLRKVAPWIQQA